MMVEWEDKNLLCFGDNLEFLSDSVLFPEECVDLIYLDPPFNSQASYNVLFKETVGSPSTAQIKAFEDTWTWDMAANESLTKIHTDSAVPAPLVELMRTFMNFLRPSPMMAYLVQMAVRLVHMHRILKSTGSLYLHCDPTASHYLKMVLDAIFEVKNFRNEIVWKRTSAHSDSGTCGNSHDVILLYSKNTDFTWNKQYQSYNRDYIESHYRHTDASGRKYRTDNLTAIGLSGGGYEYKWKGIKKIWRCPREKMKQLDNEGRIRYTRTGTAEYIRYLDEMPGVSLQDVWNDINPINSQAQERLGYQTQKPLTLLKRIVAASSNPGNVILDPFCGCGTTIDAVETLNRENPKEKPRRWIGIDVTHLATNLIKHRLTRFDPPPVYEVLGEPAGMTGAEALAKQDPFQFQFWALGLIGARPIGGKKKKGADMGIDGVRYILDEQKNGHWIAKRMLAQVKSGKVGVKDIRDFVGTLTREKSEMGVFITLAEPTGPMKAESAAAGTYTSAWDKKPYPKVQILTIDELLKDPHKPNPRCLQVPGGTSVQHTLPNAPKHKRKTKGQAKFMLF